MGLQLNGSLFRHINRQARCLLNIGHCERLTPLSASASHRPKITVCVQNRTVLFSSTSYSGLVKPHLQRMSANQPISFLRHRVTNRHTLIESVCPGCGGFVGASSDQNNLMIAEAAHVCVYADGHRATEIKPPHNRPETIHGA